MKACPCDNAWWETFADERGSGEDRARSGEILAAARRKPLPNKRDPVVLKLPILAGRGDFHAHLPD
jgi:hypothetical protein